MSGAKLQVKVEWEVKTRLIWGVNEQESTYGAGWGKEGLMSIQISAY